jgi:FKBP-type peptidyl-prolyl cis-trans isomerase
MEGKEVVIVEGKLSKIVHNEGEGELPKNGQEIYATYKGTLQNGTVFDSNLDRENPFNFVLGQGRVIKGWD